MGPLSLAFELSSQALLPAPTDVMWRSWLTDEELLFGAGLRRTVEHWGARAMAKRAVTTAIDWPSDIPWQGIEILRLPLRPPAVVLRREVDGWRRRCGLSVPGVSLTHAGGYVGAVAWLPASPCATDD